MTMKQIGAVLGAVVLAVALAVLTTSGTQAQSYKPTFGYTVAVPAGGAASNATTTFNIPSPDYNYQAATMVNFSPPDGWTEMGTVIPIADGVGTLSAAVAVGLLGGPCSTHLPPSFTLENASVDPSVVIPPGSSADPPGTNNMYWVLKSAATYPVPVAAYNPNIPDYLEAMPHFINEMLDPDGPGGDDPLTAHARYAGYTTVAGMNILIQFIVLGPGQLTELPGIYAQMGANMGHPTVVVLNNPVTADEAPGAISDFCSPLNTSTTLLATTTANPYTATGGGITARTNPPSNTGVLGTGTHMSRNYSQSGRDADGDGHENDLDPCPFTPESLWDPRGVTPAQPGLDTDGDGIPDSCDLTPAISNIDEDGDGYNNRQDNCPLVANGCTVASCSPAFPAIFNPAWDNQADDDGPEPNADLGPGPDSIGNSCDDSDCDGVEDGAVTPCSCADGIDNGPDGTTDGNDPDCAPYMDKADPDPWGANPGTGKFSHAMPWTAVTINAAVDTDGDGYSDDLEALLGSCYDDTVTTCAVQGFPDAANDEDSMPESLVIDMTLTVGTCPSFRCGVYPVDFVGASCTDQADTDGDTLIDAADNDDLGCDPSDDSYVGDDDHDGVANDGTDNCPFVKNPEQTDNNSNSIGDACEVGVGDSDNDGFSDIIEVYLGTDPLDNCPDGPGDDAWPLDMNSDASITVIGDILSFMSKIGLVNTDPAWGPAVQRLDLNGDGVISVAGDMFRFYIGMIGTGCNGGTPHPPLLPDGAPVTMGIDPEIAGNSANTLGSLEACVRIDVDPGDFNNTIADHTIDVYVTGDPQAPAPSGYDAWLVYDSDRVDPVSWDDLIKLPGAMSLTNKMAGVSRFNAGAGYLSGGPGISGDGTLVRIDLDAISAGHVCFGFGFAKAYASDANHPTIPKVASLAINEDCATDHDGDGFDSTIECYLPTDRSDDCTDLPGDVDAWPLDNNMDTWVTVGGDVLPYRGRIGAQGGVGDPNWLQRLDINMDNWITVGGDVLPFRGMIGESCT